VPSVDIERRKSVRLSRIYVSEPLAEGETVRLEATAFNHVARVLRLKAGAELILFNGEGGEFRAVLEKVERRIAMVRVGVFQAREVESPLNVVLAQGISKGERMDYTVQKSVELGVNVIQPLFTERGVVQLHGERLQARLRHWRGVVAGACEQSGRNRLPTVLNPLGLKTWLAMDCFKAGTALVLDPTARLDLKSLASHRCPVTLLIGPEGGLSPDEIDRAEAVGFDRLRLGPRVMRTETAGLAVVAVLQALWGDLGCGTVSNETDGTS
jgi:16S rRNA (uracil1498-N3)-methyltransferase